MMAAPIHHNGKIIAIACVNGIGFEQMSLYSENVLRVVTDMAGIALSRMWTFIEATNGNRYVPGTALLRRELFQEILECKRKTQEKGGLPFTVLNLPARGDDLELFSQLITRNIRPTDYVAKLEDKEVVLLLSNCTPIEAEYVIDRLTAEGIVVRLPEGGD